MHKNINIFVSQKEDFQNFIKTELKSFFFSTWCFAEAAELLRFMFIFFFMYICVYLYTLGGAGLCHFVPESVAFTGFNEVAYNSKSELRWI